MKDRVRHKSDLKLLGLFVEDGCWQKYDLRHSLQIKDIKVAAHLLEEINNYCKRNGIYKFEFAEPINIDSAQLKEFCTLIIREKLNVEWGAPIEITPRVDKSILEHIRSAGCTYLNFNLVGISDALIKKIGFNFEVRDVSNMLKLVNASGIKTFVNLLLGHPLETEQEFSGTLEFLKENSAFIKELRLDYCLSNYLSSNLFPKKVSLCHHWQGCQTSHLASSYFTFSYLDGQVERINSLGIPLKLSTRLNLFKEIVSLYILPFSIASKNGLSLFADSDAKSLRLYIRDKELTKGIGFHCAFLSNGRWHDSFGADWQFERKGNVLKLKLSWEEFGFSQIWKLSFKDNNLSWDVDNSYKKHVKFEAMKFGLFLNPEYKTFFCGHEQKQFPSEFTQWENLSFENPHPTHFGVRKENALPAIYFDLKENKDSLSPFVQNSDRIYFCRALQVGISEGLLGQNRFGFSAKIYIPDNETFIERYLEEEQKNLKQLHALSTLASDSASCFVDLYKKTIRLFYRDSELTKGIGMHTSFLFEHTWVDSSSANWLIERQKNTLSIKLSWQNIDINQIWKLYFRDNILFWQVVHKGKGKLERLKFGIFLNSGYKKFFCGYEEREFPAAFSSWRDLELENPGAARFGLKKKGTLPAVVFHQPAENWSAVIQNSDKSYMCRALQMVVSDKLSLTGGLDFSAQISLLEDDSFIDSYIQEEFHRFNKELDNSSIQSANESLVLLFNKGIGHLFYKGKELTKGLGLYTSFLSAGCWQDSRYAFWETDKISKQKIILKGKWEKIPIGQTWEFEFKTAFIIIWKVEMEILDKVIIEGEEQANIMLSDGYKNWFSQDGLSGEFHDLFSDEWKLFLEKGVEAIRFIGARSSDVYLPSVSLKCNNSERSYRLGILNTSSLFSARKLKCYRFKKDSHDNNNQRKYLYFDGEIEVSP